MIRSKIKIIFAITFCIILKTSLLTYADSDNIFIKTYDNLSYEDKCKLRNCIKEEINTKWQEAIIKDLKIGKRSLELKYSHYDGPNLIMERKYEIGTSWTPSEIFCLIKNIDSLLSMEYDECVYYLDENSEEQYYYVKDTMTLDEFFKNVDMMELKYVDEYYLEKIKNKMLFYEYKEDTPSGNLYKLLLRFPPYEGENISNDYDDAFKIQLEYVLKDDKNEVLEFIDDNKLCDKAKEFAIYLYNEKIFG